MPRFAVVDAGSNSVKILIAERHEDGSFVPIFQNTVTTRLGEGMHLGRLREAAIRRTLDAFSSFAGYAAEFEVEALCAVGTSALRSAENQNELISRANEVNIPLVAISGEEEARLSFNAVRMDPKWRDSGPLLVVDIGGGSTEVIEGHSNSTELISRESFPIGAVRLTEAVLTSNPPTIVQLDQAKSMTESAFNSLLVDGSQYTAVGVGGTFTTMASVNLKLPFKDPAIIHGYNIALTEVERQVDIYSTTSNEERSQIAGMDPARVDIILGGSLALKLLMHQIHLTQISVSTRGLRWGLMYDRFLNYQAE